METQSLNPVVIMLINMTIVFAVLFVISLFIRLIHIVDPAKPKKAAPAPVAAPAPAPAAPAAPVVEAGISGETVAVIAAALASYGVGFSQVKAIRPANSASWANAGRMNNLNKM